MYIILHQEKGEKAMTDDEIIQLWLHGRSGCTRRAYEGDIHRLRGFLGKPLVEATLGDLQAFSDSLGHLAASSQARILASAKSFYHFCVEQGLMPANPSFGLKLPKAPNRLAERILTEEQVLKMLALEEAPQRHCLLRLLYASGIRVSELAGLRWKDVQPHGTGGQITVLGKGGKTRSVALPDSVYTELLTLRDGAGDDEPVFRNEAGGALSTFQVWKIVREAAKRAGITANVSPHWLRHCHASHSLERGASVVLVKETLGHSSITTTTRYLHARPGRSSGDYLPV